MKRRFKLKQCNGPFYGNPHLTEENTLHKLMSNKTHNPAPKQKILRPKYSKKKQEGQTSVQTSTIAKLWTRSRTEKRTSDLDSSRKRKVSKQICIGEVARPAGVTENIIQKQRRLENFGGAKYTISNSNNCSTDQMNCNCQLGPGGEIE